MKLNILITEDEIVSVKLLQQYINEYVQNNDCNIDEIVVDVAYNGWEALGMLAVNEYDILFLDVKMPRCDGFKVLNYLRLGKLSEKNIHICMLTAYGDKKHKLLFRLKGANAYIIKPINKDIILTVLDNFIKANFTQIPTETTEVIDEANSDTNTTITDDTQDDEFVDFDGDDDLFLDFDDEFIDCYDDILDEDDAKELAHANTTHKKVPASVFLEDYDNLDYILDITYDIEAILDELIKNLSIETFENYREDVDLVLSKFTTFLNSFADFYELSSAIYLLKTTLEKFNIEDFDTKKAAYIVEFVRTIIQDISNWQDHVFVTQDAVDVFYINASILNSCIQLKDLMKDYE